MAIYLSIATACGAKSDGLFSTPPDGGVFFDPAKPADIAAFNKKTFTIEPVDNGKAIQATCNDATGWPDFDFPAPSGGWNLSDYGGVKMDVTDSGQTPAIVNLRIDNVGDWHGHPWSTEMVKLAPGETKTLSVTFGVTYHMRGYDLDPAKILRIKLFLGSPQPPTVLTLRNVVAFPKSEMFHPKAVPPPDPTKISEPGFTKPADRDVPVTPAAWVGKKPPVDGDWVKTLDENFEGATLNDKVWTNRPFGDGVFTQSQYYSKQNAIVDHGVLILRSEKRPGHCMDDPKMPAKDYASGYIDTFGKWTQTYGYFEAKIKLPTARGLWPAFWLMPDRGPAGNADLKNWLEVKRRTSTNNDGMEFDILEQLAEWGPGRYNIAAHWDGYGVDHKKWGNSSTYFGPTADGWHTFGMLWEPGKATFYCDGIKKAEFASDRVGSCPEYIILNLQMGGWATSNIDDSKLPDEYQVQYVRVWQLKNRVAAKP